MKKLFLLSVIIFVFLSACGSSRDLSNVKTSLYGHWTDEESGAHYYVGDGILIQVIKDKVEEKTYKVLEHDEVKNMVKIREETESGTVFDREITFKNDKRETAEVMIDASSYKIGKTEFGSEAEKLINERVREANKDNEKKHDWKYIDDKQRP
ncbi:hypothetical protein [Priestia taiwanensis]|uniref:Lipoprotein n=1 Tax=Priestia taiwanensis TaxID=1347902 RepID=A0A917AV65_9BACI|nr:hypothetical protein [Priestia taiwanensis]MBM7363556.1 uncharacterized lipoprotein YehR (DUF1307 family) [Priestia taiwanensis]GGE76137.1 hypothetical protein GCM10007140_27350 [Priestia taiwanensis]